MTNFPSERELVLDRLIDAPRAAVFRCWTEADLLKQWFAPAPWSVSQAEIEPRVGGAHSVTMRGPDGTEMPGPGVILDIVPDEKLVMTDAFTTGWEPGDGAPFMVLVISFADEGGKTRYVARARHWTKESTEEHVKMGFHEGWNKCADQLEALAKSL